MGVSVVVDAVTHWSGSSSVQTGEVITSWASVK